MAFPITINGRTYTLADFEGTNYVDGFPDALEDFVTQAGNLYTTTSTSSVAIGTGEKTFTVADSGKPYIVGTPLRIADSAAPSTNWIDGIVTSYSGTTLVVDAVAYAGSGTKTAWNINIGGSAIAYTGTLPIAQGGTGGTTAAAARTNIDVYSKSEADSRFLNVSGEASDVTMTGNVTIGDAGTDTLTINANVTGNVAFDTDTLFVDAANNRVGVGDSSPDTAFKVTRTDGTAYAASSASLPWPINTDSPAVTIRNLSTAADTGAYLGFGSQEGGGVKLSYIGSVGGNTYTPEMVFGQRTGANSYAESMRLNTSGNLVIGGTDASFAKFSVRNGYAYINEDGIDTKQIYIRSDLAGVPAIQVATNHALAIRTNNAERMRVESNGDVAIGTPSTGSYRLRVADGGYDAGIQLNGTLEPDRYGAAIEAFVSGGGSYLDFLINQNNSGFVSGMRLDFNRRLLLNRATTTTSGVVNIKVGASALDVGVRVQSVADGNWALAFNNTIDTNVGQIVINSSSTSYNTTSDYRLKEGVQPMVGASDRVLALNPVNFAWIATGERVDGFIAHEAQAVVPEAVSGAKDAMRQEEYEITPAVFEDVIIPAVLDDEGNEIEPQRIEQRLVTEAVMGTREVPEYQGIDQSKLVPLLTAALQEALGEIADLKARVAALEV